MNKIEVSGNIPKGRFGHTFTQISNEFAILFGGATGSSEKFAITNDVYSFEISKQNWKKATGILFSG